MSPQLALLLAIGFIAAAYIHENQRRGKTSAAVWIATLWMMRCGSRGLDEWRGGGISDDGGASGIDQIFIFVVAVLGFSVVARRWSQVKTVLGRNWPILLYYGYITLSVLWSGSQLDSAKQLFRAFGDLAIVLLVLTEANPLEAILTMFRRGLLLLIPLSVVFAKYFSELGRMREKNWEPDSWIGVTTHKNCLGQLCFLALIVFVIEIARSMHQRRFSIWRVPLKMPFEVIYIALSIYLLNGGGAKSTTSILCVFVAMGLFLLLEKLRSRPRLASKTLLALICGLGFLYVAVNFFGGSLSAIVASSQGKDPTLTGRTELWADILDIDKRPWFGPGFMGFWSPEVKAHVKKIPRESWGPEHADCGYVETYIQMGWVGVLLLGLLIIHGYIGANKALKTDFDWGRFRLVLLLTTLLQNVTESGFPRPMQILWFTFLLVALDHARSRLPQTRKLAEWERGIKPPVRRSLMAPY
ncbi:MAG: O-antigen ligase family protein [Verrucomicrobia bacterium]|nr:O-antigen ligase family protein [Verrucomicrobiota bacterium]